MRRFVTLLCSLLLCTFILSRSTVFGGAIPDGPNVRVTDAGLGSDDAKLPQIVAVNGTLYTTWLDDRTNDNAVYFAKSTDDGKTWTQNLRVSALPFDDWVDDPGIAVQPDGTIWILWYQFYRENSNKVNNLRLAQSTDGGETFARYTLLDGRANDEDLWQPRIAADSKNIYVLFHDYESSGGSEGYNIYLRVISGKTLSFPDEDLRLNDQPFTGRVNDRLLDDGPIMSLKVRDGETGTTVCAAWEDTRDRFAIYGACSTDNGTSVAGPNFAISGSDSITPKIALGPENVLYATYTLDADSDDNIQLRRSTDLGATWSEERQITRFEIGDVRTWDIAIEETGQIVLPWIHDVGSSSNLILATSVDDGQNFAGIGIEDEQGRFPSTSDQYGVSVALGGEGSEGRAYLLWEDDRNVQDEIWFASAILDGTPPTTPANLQATADDTAIKLSWDAATDANGVAGYYVFRATAEAGPFSQLSPLLVRETQYVDVGLDETTYFYRVITIDSTGNNGVPSNVASAAAQIGTSPPQGTIIYEQDDGIRIRPLAGGDEIAITEASQPILSPDGQRIYYRNGDTISSRAVDGSEPQLYITREGIRQFDINADGSRYGAIVQRTQTNIDLAICFVFEPVFSAKGPDLFIDQYNYSSDVALSTDARWLAYRYDGFCNAAASGFTRPGDFCMVDLNSNEKNCIKGADFEDADFAPSGSELVIAAPFDGQDEIWRAQVQEDGTLANYVQLTKGAANQPAAKPAWSSDGNWIVFQRDVDPGEGEDWQLMTVRKDGAVMRSLNLAGDHPAWISDGNGSLPTPTPGPPTPTPRPPTTIVDTVYLPLVRN